MPIGPLPFAGKTEIFRAAAPAAYQLGKEPARGPRQQGGASSPSAPGASWRCEPVCPGLGFLVSTPQSRDMLAP